MLVVADGVFLRGKRLSADSMLISAYVINCANLSIYFRPTTPSPRLRPDAIDDLNPMDCSQLALIIPINQLTHHERLLTHSKRLSSATMTKSWVKREVVCLSLLGIPSSIYLEAHFPFEGAQMLFRGRPMRVCEFHSFNLNAKKRYRLISFCLGAFRVKVIA